MAKLLWTMSLYDGIPVARRSKDWIVRKRYAKVSVKNGKKVVEIIRVEKKPENSESVFYIGPFYNEKGVNLFSKIDPNTFSNMEEAQRALSVCNTQSRTPRLVTSANPLGKKRTK